MTELKYMKWEKDMFTAKFSRSTLGAIALATVMTGCQTVGPYHSASDSPEQAQAQARHFHFFHHHMKRPIPPEMLTACQGKTAGDSVTITLHNGRVMQGTCELRFRPALKQATSTAPVIQTSAK